MTRYPAIFVDDVLVATPKDFGFFGKGEGKDEGRYAPLKSVEAHERFRADLTKMISLILAGRKDAARATASPSKRGDIESLPASFAITDLDGRKLTRADLEGRVVLVEFWATWCPPCRSTLAWLGELKKRYGNRVAVIAISIESEEANVRKLSKDIGAPLTWTMGTPELARSFGDISAVPSMFLFDQNGKTAATFFGAPPTLHQDAEAKIAAIVKTPKRRNG